MASSPSLPAHATAATDATVDSKETTTTTTKTTKQHSTSTPASPPSRPQPKKQKPCPETKANFFSRLFYEWMTSFIWLGFKKPLETEDLYLLAEDNQSQRMADRFEELWKEEKEKLIRERSQDRQTPDDQPLQVSVYRVLFRQFGWRYVAIGAFHIVQAAANIASPTLINKLTAFVQDSQPGATNPPPLWLGFVYAVVFFVLQVISTLFLNKYFHHSMRTGMRVRSCLTTVAYRKTMKLDGLSRQKFSSGQILNMISSDLARIEQFLMQGAYLVSGPLQVIANLSLLIYYIGVSALAGFGLLIIMIPVQAWIFTRLAMLRREVAGITDSRVRLTQEFLSGMRIIKLFAWETKFLDRLMKIRGMEVAKIQFANMWTAVLMGIANSIPVFASVVAFIVYGNLSSNTIIGNSPIIFASLAYFSNMRYPLILIPSVIRLFVESKVAFRRLTVFMNGSELEKIDYSSKDTEYAIQIKDGQFQWQILAESEKFQDRPKGGKAAVVETKKEAASVPASPTKEAAAAAPGSPTKESASTPGSPTAAEQLGDIPLKKVDRVHLRNINLRVKKGDLVAVVGGVGSGKSTLLNALLGEVKKLAGDVAISGSVGYSLQQPWIQNGTLKKNVLFGNEYDDERFKNAVHVTALEKDLEWLPGGSDTLLGEKGIQCSGGQRARVSLARIVYCNPDVVLLDDPLSAVDVHVGKHIFSQCIRHALKEKTVVLVTHQLNYLREVDYIVYMKDGEIIEQGTYDELMALDGECARVVHEFAGEHEHEEEQPKSMHKEAKAGAEDKGKSRAMMEEERLIGAVSSEVYRAYIKSAGGNGIILMTAIIAVFAQCMRLGNDLWLVGWTSNTFPTLGDPGYSGIYFLWGLMSGATSSALGAMLSYAFARASNAFHKEAIHGVFRAPITFFDTTPLGRIVNRFSKDTDTMDSSLPMSMQMFLSIFTGLIATLALMIYGTYWLVIPLVPLMVIYLFMQQLYMRTSRELKRLESISRSPVYTHFSESMTGLSTIRAYKRQSQFMEDLYCYVDRNNEVAYLQIMVQRWLGFRLETLGALICFFTAAFAILFASSLDAALIGLTLTYSLQVTGGLNFAIRQAVEVEVNANSIERLHHYARRLDQEADYVIESNRPDAKWPEEGKIDTRNLIIKYSPEGPPVLKDVSFEIKANEKVGIVGRTGAGKSTITLALFRLLEPASGQVTIDGLDCSKIGLHDLRSRLAIIPQDPILFSGTVRSNLDPFDLYTDDDMWNVLKSVNMKEAIAALPDALVAKVDPNGENFSTGQRQLLCLARAMLRKPRVLIMDEATANVDMESDQLIQISLRKDFKKSTILTIAHRLNTVIDYDRILVLEQGEVVEFDSPVALLDKPEGIFAKMVDNTGAANASLLRKLANEKQRQGEVDVVKLLAVEAETQ